MLIEAGSFRKAKSAGSAKNNTHTTSAPSFHLTPFAINILRKTPLLSGVLLAVAGEEVAPLSRLEYGFGKGGSSSGGRKNGVVIAPCQAFPKG